MPHSVVDPPDLPMFRYIVTHVFCPLQLPDGDDHSVHHDHALAREIASVACLHSERVTMADVSQWHPISRMLDNLRATVQFESLDPSQTVFQLTSMQVGDVLAFLIRSQNAAVLFRKRKDVTIFESFEVSPKAENVMTTQGKLICSYPGPAIEIPNTVFEDKYFLSELANFLVRMNDDILDAAPTTQKSQSTVIEERDTVHPRYITELLTGILRGLGRPANVVRITKRVGDDVIWNNSRLPWRRSSLWLLIRVAIRTSLDQSPATYKHFMLFFMCCIADNKLTAELSNDLLRFMSAKISRRLMKLGSSAPDWLSCTVFQTCTSLRLIQEKRWRQTQAIQCISPPWTPSQLDLPRDIELSLSSGGEYLCNTLANNINSARTRFSPEHHPRGSLDDFLGSEGEFFEEAYSADPYVTLYDVERAVEQGIDAWIDQVTDSDQSCLELEILAEKYSSSALKTYSDNPELLSVMLLTVIELWVALDKIAVKEIPMLADYSPEVPTSLLEDLLLCKTGCLHRLRHVHQYLSNRHSQCHSGWSVFSPSIAPDNFAVRFYEGSPHLQHLKARIEMAAWRDVREKVAELERANARHAELIRQASCLHHESFINWRGVERHDRYCTKCSIEREYTNMQIILHEWPLPAGRLHASAVVFELDCPISFNMWRSATLHLLVDLCSPSTEPKGNPYTQLDKYAALQPYLVQHARSRITLASDTKPFVVTHYSNKSIPATQEQVCVNNGLIFYGFDTRARIAISEVSVPFDIRQYCTYELQAGPYENLQTYVDGTCHTSNRVLASQVDCDRCLSIHEYIAFGHLRSGGLLQWLNILRELRGRSLTFRRSEVHFLLAQAVSQVGPLDGTELRWHQELEEPTFGDALLGELESLVRDVEANWLELVTMDSISLMLRRLLSSSPNQVISLKALKLLRAVRSKVFSWVTELSDKLEETPGDEELRGFLRDAAAICRNTFDVDTSVIRHLLHSAEDLKVLLSSVILINHHTPSKTSNLPINSRLLLDRNCRLSLAVEGIVSDIIQADSSDEGINNAIHWVWPNYRAGSKWIPLPCPNSRWFSCTTASTNDQSSQVVHFNVLDGSLLVDGKPLGRLPREILQHSQYNLIFGGRVLDVIPSDLPGMDYATRGLVSNHQVYFSLRNDSDLVIRAKQDGDSQIIELIPQSKLEGDLPAVLIEGHAHWLNLATSIMEIHPLGSLWESSSENWKMNCTPGQYRIQRGNEFLVDIRSESWKMVSDLLLPLDSPQNLLVSISPIDSSQRLSPSQLSVSLPRYGLSFYIDEDGDLQSHNMRGMIYDENQCIGTLFGLVNRLILRPKTRDIDAVELIPRCILIPDGEISFQKDGHHVRIGVDTPSSAFARVTYQSYSVNTELGCLTGNVSLTNKLYCAYLHALTSGCGIDPLTGRTGTEEALSMLRSANCSSIMRVGSREAELLGLIASLCPTRTWYPKHLKRMQKVEWLNLPANTQHHELYVAAKGIKEHCERVLLFHESQPDPLFQQFPVRDDDLLERAALRMAYLFPSEFSEQPSGINLDVPYSARDLVAYAPGEQRAYIAATSVHRRVAHAATRKNILARVESWRRNVSRNAPLSLQYDKAWLTPDLPLIWLQAYQLLRESDDSKWFQMVFSLPAMAYHDDSSDLIDLVPMFVAFARDTRFRLEDPPRYSSYNITEGYSPCPGTLRSYVSDSACSFESSPESKEPASTGESPESLRQRRSKLYRGRIDSDSDTAVQRLLDAWPCEIPQQPSLNPNLYQVSSLISNVQEHFSTRYRNLMLKEHLTRVQNILDNVYTQASPIPTCQYAFQPSQYDSSSNSWSIAFSQLFARLAPSLPEHDRLPLYTAKDGNSSLPSSAPLQRLLATVQANAVNGFQRQYISALRTSAECLGREMTLETHCTTKLPTAETLKEHYARCKDSYFESLRLVKCHLGPSGQNEAALECSGQWPRITAHALFRSLASSSPISLSESWKECLIRLSLLALELQRARRLRQLLLDDHSEELRRELQNEGCDGWNAEAHPDWLLVQLQSNFLVRRVQAEVANEMISPRLGTNTAMQLNMGEGKSSVIVPIVVAALADGSQLVRVIVPKALTSQMFDLLVDRLGGLVNRRIFFLPFSRSLEVNHEKVAALQIIMSECMKERGILVVQPEHVLSLKLVSVEKQLLQEEERELAELLLALQRWLYSHSRDILDEIDEILHVRYQLVYTIGLQKHMEGFPDRWMTTAQVLGLVSRYASRLRQLFPHGVEYESGPPGSFPHLRILHPDAGQKLISWIVENVMDGRLANFNFGQLRSGLRNAIRSFISCENVLRSEVQLVKGHSQDTPLWSGLLLLRGLFANGIIFYALRERRWRVDYGLAPTRTMLAVPYRAKDIPAQRAEFGHPDIAIVLTYLSYYYHGLSEEQLRLSFEILLKQDDPYLDYDVWVQDRSAVPEWLQSLKGVNIKSSEQWNQYLFPLFKRNKAAVDFYLWNVVFPKEAKEFPSKLSCSGWDLAEKKENLLTGFSGTNDGQHLLPLHITQRDPDHQRGTNAKVLSYLLQPENKHYMCMSHENGKRRTTREFLEMLAAQKPKIRVLLDVGAQMMDLDNVGLAKVWLEIDTNASAAIYFNKDDELTVLTRDGSMNLLISSPFAQQLGQCVVYLDDAHTRGTNIKFPSGFRAAVTLGPKVTKDRLVQGCMRMRKLGYEHTIMFFAPLEIDRRIRSVVGKGTRGVIDTMDILQWTIRETCDDIQHRAPQWAQQGMDHTSRFAAWTNFCENTLSARELSDEWLQPEAKTLEDLYGPHTTFGSTLVADPEIRQHCIKLGVSSLRDVSMDEEQEREVVHEVERERQVERPPRVSPAVHSIHPDVVAFVKTGIIPRGSDGFRRAFDTLEVTSAAAKEPHIWSPRILATAEFEKTVRSSSKLDDYLRPVMWVVSGQFAHDEALVILSPYEVGQLLPEIRSSDKVHLHLYTPRVIRSMKPCDDLSLYNIPPTGWTPPAPLMDQLNIFAGQLYLSDYGTYIRLCRFLCVYSRHLKDEENIEVECDGFISPRNWPWHLQSASAFRTSPLDPLKTLMGLRRKGMRFSSTDMGKLLDGRLLSEADFADVYDDVGAVISRRSVSKTTSTQWSTEFELLMSLLLWILVVLM